MNELGSRIEFEASTRWSINSSQIPPIDTLRLLLFKTLKSEEFEQEVTEKTEGLKHCDLVLILRFFGR
jgi:hypothetical protein